MRNSFFIVVVLLMLTACRKENRQPDSPAVSHPEMQYRDLHDAAVYYQHTRVVDVDNDGSADYTFSVQLVGDPVLQRDRWQFMAHSGVNKNLLNDASDRTPVLNRMEVIGKQMNDYTWYEISAIVLAEKIVTNNGNYWDGNWKSAVHKYLPIQVKKHGKVFHGWIELSVDTATEKLLLHRSAISQEEEKNINAGY